MLELFLLTFYSGEPIWKLTGMQVTEKETEFGLGRGTEKVCGLGESRKGYLIQERPSTMVRTTASHQAGGQMPSVQTGLLPEETGPGSLGAHSLLSPFCPLPFLAG